MSKGILLVNLGSPASPQTADVRRYLREFLSDDRVLDIPKILQQGLLRFFILPTRSSKSAAAYQKIWTDEGSPLVASSLLQRDALQLCLDMSEDLPVEVGMRYGEPSTASAIRRLLAKGVDDIFLIPLYPHYAKSSFETALVKVRETLQELSPQTKLSVQAPFYADDDYIEALVSTSLEQIDSDYDLLLFSYHGIPEHHLPQDGNPALCYRTQVEASTQRFVERAAIPEHKWRLSFQSRMGRRPWLKPFTDHELLALPAQGYKRIAVICPSFVSDCLETLEEIDIRGRAAFMAAGGQDFRYIHCLNDDLRWVQVLERMVLDWSRNRRGV